MAYDNKLQSVLAIALADPNLAAQLFNTLVSPNYDPSNAIYTAAGAIVMAAGQKVAVVNKAAGAASSVTLPPNPVAYQRATVKDGKGDSATNVITITPAAGQIDGGANFVINTPYGVADFMYNGTQWNSLSQMMLPPGQYTTAALQSAVIPGTNMAGSESVSFENTGTTPANLQVDTAANIVAAIPNARVGMAYDLAIRNSSGGANTATITTNTGVTLHGTMTIAQNTTRYFKVVLTSLTAVDIWSMGVSAAAV